MTSTDYSLEDLSDISPYENYITAIRDVTTRKKYAGQLEMFLNPKYDWEKSQQKRKLLSEKKFIVLVNGFAELIRKDPHAGKNKIKRYVMSLKQQIDNKTLNPNTARNRLKPIKTLLRANEIDFSWYLIDRMMPKESKSGDRAYTRAEIQKMIIHCEDITDKVIITAFSCAGFRLEAWNYFTWSDVVFFKNEDNTYKGGALRIYHGDAEEYWTHITPEFCKLLDLYKVYWKSKFFADPLPSDPLLAQERLPYPARLKSGGVSRRVRKVVDHLGLRNEMIPGKQRYVVQLDHGFRKYFNTMLRRAKVDFADKEDMMGHKVALESSYERYEEADFERFAEYQKAIPFLTISDEERQKIKIETLESKQKDIENLQENMEKIIAEKMNQYSSKFIKDFEKIMDKSMKRSSLTLEKNDLKLLKEMSEDDEEFEKMKSVYNIQQNNPVTEGKDA
ncbi:MAG: tyrosine-type recombinase/integrase [Candidatus Nitrosopumilus sp. bin_32a]